jgi:hypothetical protein
MNTTTQEFQQSPEPSAPAVTYSTTETSPAPARLYHFQAQPESAPASNGSEPNGTAPFLLPEAEAEAAAAEAESIARVEAIINDALDLTEGDIEQELRNWRHDYLSVDRRIHSLGSFLAIEDEMRREVPGAEAIRRITGIQELSGEDGAVAAYTSFLIDFRFRRPEGYFPDNAKGDRDWFCLASAYSTYFVTRILADGMDGSRCFADRLAYELWVNPPVWSIKRGRLSMQWVPWSPHVNASRGGKARTTGRISKSHEDRLSGGGRNSWSPEEKAAGIDKAYYSENAKSCRAIPEALQEARAMSNLAEIRYMRGGLMGEEDRGFSHMGESNEPA